MPVKPEIFETAFLEGTNAKMDEVEITFYPFNMGNINIDSGKIIACDPIVMHHAVPFDQIFPIGSFPVQLSICKIEQDERVAFSRIIFSNKEIAKWEFALKQGQDPRSIFGDELYGYGVDGGTGLFMDEKANQYFLKELDEKDKSIWGEIFVKKMGENYSTTWQYLLYNFNGHNVAAFSTGYGDGFYATYIGYDNDDSICQLLTDFSLVEWWKTGNEQT